MPIAAPPAPAKSDKLILPAFLLAFFFGIFGAHRFYVGKIGTAFLQLFTLGGLGIWCTIDWILILCKEFTDGQGKKLTQWLPTNPNSPKPVPPPPSIRPTTGAERPNQRSAMIIAPAVSLMVAGSLESVVGADGSGMDRVLF